MISEDVVQHEPKTAFNKDKLIRFFNLCIAPRLGILLSHDVIKAHMRQMGWKATDTNLKGLMYYIKRTYRDYHFGVVKYQGYIVVPVNKQTS